MIESNLNKDMTLKLLSIKIRSLKIFKNYPLYSKIGSGLSPIWAKFAKNILTKEKKLTLLYLRGLKKEMKKSRQIRQPLQSHLGPSLRKLGMLFKKFNML